MTKKKDVWMRVAVFSGVIVTLGAASAVLQPFVPWAPKELVLSNFAMAAENTLDRWRSEYIKIQFLIEQARNASDQISQATWEKQLLVVKHKIAALEAEKASSPVSNVYGSAEYKREMVKVLTARALKEALERAQETL